MDRLKIYLLLQMVVVHCYVSVPEGRTYKFDLHLPKAIQPMDLTIWSPISYKWGENNSSYSVYVTTGYLFISRFIGAA